MKTSDQRNALAAELVQYARGLWFAYSKNPKLEAEFRRLGIDMDRVELLAGGGAEQEQKRRAR